MGSLSCWKVQSSQEIRQEPIYYKCLEWFRLYRRTKKTKLKLGIGRWADSGRKNSWKGIWKQEQKWCTFQSNKLFFVPMQGSCREETRSRVTNIKWVQTVVALNSQSFRIYSLLSIKLYFLVRFPFSSPHQFSIHHQPPSSHSGPLLPGIIYPSFFFFLSRAVSKKVFYFFVNCLGFLWMRNWNKIKVSSSYLEIKEFGNNLPDTEGKMR